MPIGRLNSIFAQLGARRPFPKIDVQGAGERRLRGAGEVDVQDRRVQLEIALYEFYHGQLLMDEALTLMRNLGIYSIIDRSYRILRSRRSPPSHGNGLGLCAPNSRTNCPTNSARLANVDRKASVSQSLQGCTCGLKKGPNMGTPAGILIATEPPLDSWAVNCLPIP